MDKYEIANDRDRGIKRVEYLKMVRRELNNYKGMNIDDVIATMTDEIKSSAKRVRTINSIMEDDELIEMLCDCPSP